MKYWLSVFSSDTWGEFLAQEKKCCAFAESRFSPFPKIQVGDRFLCYISKLQVWTACLEVIGERFNSQSRIFQGGVYPIRFPVHPELMVSVDRAVAMESLEGKLSFFPAGGTGKNWSPYVRNSARNYAAADALVIIDALRDAGQLGSE